MNRANAVNDERRQVLGTGEEHMRATRWVMLALLLIGGVALADKLTLDGRSFAIVTGEKGKPPTERETLIFQDGKFHSTGCDPYGFTEAVYRVKPAPRGGISFEADTTSAKEGKIHWQGTVQGESVQGTFVWTKAGQPPIEYTFKSTKP